MNPGTGDDPFVVRIDAPGGSGGARAEAEKLGVPVLAEIPLEVPLREACDQGRPLVATAPESAAAKAFIAAAKALI